MWLNDLEAAEKIVKENDKLVWDQWDILVLVASNNPVVYKDARYIKGKWWRTRRIPLTEKGWWLPSERKKT